MRRKMIRGIEASGHGRRRSRPGGHYQPVNQFNGEWNLISCRKRIDLPN
ncbi:hypothetical protein [Caproicibacter sp. BJN0012]